MTSTVLFAVADGVADITLNRPDAANGIDRQMAADLLDVAIGLRHDSTVRAVLLTGAGARFCAGGDVRSFAGAGDDVPRLLREITTDLHAAISILVNLDAPLIAAVQGSAAGAGLGLVCAADLVLAGASCKFVMAYTGIGLTPDGSTTWHLPRIVGARRAMELTLTNRVLDAAEAAALGLVTDVVADDELADRARALARQLAAGPTLAYGAAKRLLRASAGHDLETQMARESDAISAAAATVDGREGIASFVQRRPPTFSGR